MSKLSKQRSKFLSRVNREHGDKSANALSERDPVDAVSSGSVAVDYIIGPYCPGFPLGKLSMVYGPEQSAKSLLMCQTMTEAQKRGLPVFLIDRENHYTPEWFERFGGNAEEIIDLDPRTIEQAFGMLKQAVTWMEDNSLEGGFFIIDSLQSLPTETQYQDDSPYSEGLAGSARYLSSKLPGMVERVWRTKLGIISVGQIRNDPSPYGKDYTPGGNALSHFSVLRLKLSFRGAITAEISPGVEDRVGFLVKVSTDKNNVGGRARGESIEIPFDDYHGADNDQSLFDIAQRLGIIEGGAGGYYKLPKLDVSFRGKDNWKEHLTKDLKDEIIKMAFDPKIALAREAERLTSDGEENDED